MKTKPAWWQRPAPRRWSEGIPTIRPEHHHVFVVVGQDDNSLAMKCVCGEPAPQHLAVGI